MRRICWFQTPGKTAFLDETLEQVFENVTGAWKLQLEFAKVS